MTAIRSFYIAKKCLSVPQIIWNEFVNDQFSYRHQLKELNDKLKIKALNQFEACWRTNRKLCRFRWVKLLEQCQAFILRELLSTLNSNITKHLVKFKNLLDVKLSSSESDSVCREIIKINFSQVNNRQTTAFYNFSHLKRELRNLKNRRYRARRSLSDHPSYINNENNSCARCQAILGKILNRGASCLLCNQKICRNCREISYGTNWICSVCQKQMWVDDFECGTIFVQFSINQCSHETAKQNILSVQQVISSTFLKNRNVYI